MSKSTNNKRIAKNTLYLYLRMLFVMAIGLYTVRAILDILGEVDYGLYNVVGGVVTMFAFMNKTLSTSSQRYFSIELARGDKERLSKWFCLNITSFGMLGLIIAFFLETVGLWFLNTQMTIPEERLTAANVVYQLSIVSFLFHIISIPYLALVIAHEKMNVFAYVGIIEALGRLAIVFILMMLTYDKLIFYGILVLINSVGISMAYIIYCRKHYSESKYSWYWNTSEVKELFGFSGWHFLGTFSVVCRSQGINILLNLFFNPAVNAARAVAFQIYGAAHQLVTNFFTAVKPQIYKSYASEMYEDLYKLINRSTMICTFLLSLLVFPLMSNTEMILGWWLKKVPEYAVIFTQLVLINGLVDSLNLPMTAAALATGKIRKYELWLSTITLLNIPISYLVLKLGAPPYAAMLVSIFLACVCVWLRAYLLKGMIQFPVKPYFSMALKVLVVTITMFVVINWGIRGRVIDLFTFITFSIIIEIVLIGLYALIIGKSDRHLIYNTIKKKIGGSIYKSN
jgi:O-antigen/teichoic acid export membrane protein